MVGSRGFEPLAFTQESRKAVPYGFLHDCSRTSSFPHRGQQTRSGSSGARRHTWLDYDPKPRFNQNNQQTYIKTILRKRIVPCLVLGKISWFKSRCYLVRKMFSNFCGQKRACSESRVLFLTHVQWVYGTGILLFDGLFMQFVKRGPCSCLFWWKTCTSKKQVREFWLLLR